MYQFFLIVLLIIAIGFLFISIKVLLGRNFPNFHLDGNKALNKKGIRCVHDMEKDERRVNPFCVKE